MAHRKPLGTTCTGPLDWPRDRTDPLELGDYLRSGACTWYRVVGIAETSNPDRPVVTQERIAEPEHADCECRFAADEAGVVRRVHDFVWYPRHRR